MKKDLFANNRTKTTKIKNKVSGYPQKPEKGLKHERH